MSSSITHTGVGQVSNTNGLGYSFSFATLNREDIQVEVINPSNVKTTKTVTTHYTIQNYLEAGSSNAYIEFVSETARGFQNSQNDASSYKIRISRQTPSVPKVNFTAGSSITASDLNIQGKQAFHLSEENRDSITSLAAGDASSAIQISGSNIADNSITTAKIVDLEVGTNDLANLAVTTGKIADLNVTTGKIANLNVTTGKIADSNVTTDKIADSNVTEAKLAIHNTPSVNKVLGYTSNGLEWIDEALTFTKPSCLLKHPPDTALAHVSNSNTSNGVPITHQDIVHNVGIAGQVCVVSNSNSRIQVKVAGTYLVSALTSGTIANTPDPSDAVGFVLLKNGSIYTDEQTFAQSNFGATAGEEYFLSFCIPIVLAVDEYLEVAYMNINNSQATIKKGYFSVSKI